MQPEHVAAIDAEWLRTTSHAPAGLRTFLTELVPDADAWALRRAGASPGREPEVLAVTASHLYRVTRSDVDGHPALGFQRWPLGDVRVAKLVEWREDHAELRRWTLHMGDDRMTIDTRHDGAAPPSLERLLRLLLTRAG
jgi:hypothetical protein